MLIAVFNRSISLISGFCLLIRNDNFICAARLIRLQLDSAIRFYAFFLNQKSDEIFTKFMNGEKLSGIKDSLTGKRFTDDYLFKNCVIRLKNQIKRKKVNG